MKRLLFIFLLFFTVNLYAGTGNNAVVARKNAVPNGLMGVSTQDTSDSIFTPAYSYQTKYQPTTAGAVNYIHAYIANANGLTVCLSLHSSDGTVLAYFSGAPVTNVAGWFNGQLNTGVSLTDATNYYLAINASNTLTAYMQSSGGSSVFYDTGIGCGSSLSSPEAGVYYGGYDLTIIVNNTSGNP